MTTAPAKKRHASIPRSKSEELQTDLMFGQDSENVDGSDPVNERFRRIWKPCWIDYPMASEGLARLDRLYRLPKSHRPKGALIVGDPNMGKTSLVREFQRAKNPKIDPKEELTRVPVVYIQSPPTADGAGIYTAILRALNAPFRAGSRILEKQDQVLSLLGKLDTKVLVIAEMHNMLDGKVDQRGIYMNVLRHLSNDLQLSIVGVGTTSVLRAVQTDQQLGSRMEPFRLRNWKFGTDYCNFIFNICAHAGISNFDAIRNKAFLDRIHRLSGGLTGETWELMGRLIETAFDNNDGTFDPKMLDKLNWIAPDDRRSAAE